MGLNLQEALNVDSDRSEKIFNFFVYMACKVVEQEQASFSSKDFFTPILQFRLKMHFHFPFVHPLAVLVSMNIGVSGKNNIGIGSFPLEDYHGSPFFPVMDPPNKKVKVSLSLFVLVTHP